MKNIHVLPTDKPSRLHLQNGNLVLHRLQYTLVSQHIYITNDEEINQNTKPCWCLNTIKKTWDKDVVYFQGAMPQYHYIGFKKIILTTDQDLIKEGVQAIDDEFLEWFVKNPSCEWVKVVDYPMVEKYNSRGEYIHHNYWTLKIIIPKQEEQKQHLIDMMRSDEELELYDEPKQETLEEAAERFLKDGAREFKTAKQVLIGFAKWQQQQNKNLYSEEDMTKYALYILNNTVITPKEWFEQFKKK